MLRDTPLMLSLDNPTKSDIREFIKSMSSLINGSTETGNRFHPKTTTVETISTVVAVEQKVITDK